MKSIPFDPTLSANQTFTSNLGDATVRFTLQWNGRAGAWFCDFETSEGSSLGVMLAADHDLLDDPEETLGIDGNFRVLKFVAMADPLGYSNLGNDWKLVYATSDEWEEWDGVE